MFSFRSIAQPLVDVACLVGIVAFSFEMNRHIALKALNLLGLPPFRLVWEKADDEYETEDEEDRETDEIKKIEAIK